MIIKKLGDFEGPAAHDDARVKLSAYQVELKNEIDLIDPELEEYRFIGPDWKEQGIKLPTVIERDVLPLCIKTELLNWN